MNSCPRGIPVKIPVTVAKNRNSCNHLQNHVPLKKSSRKHREKRKPQESLQEWFFGPKNKFLKTGICNLEQMTHAVLSRKTSMSSGVTELAISNSAVPSICSST
jgi:hypothetical protein